MIKPDSWRRHFAVGKAKQNTSHYHNNSNIEHSRNCSTISSGCIYHAGPIAQQRKARSLMSIPDIPQHTSSLSSPSQFPIMAAATNIANLSINEPNAAQQPRDETLDPNGGLRVHRGNHRGGQLHNNARGRGRGRGIRTNRDNSQDQRRQQSARLQAQPAPPRPPPDDLGGGGVSGESPARDTTKEEGGEGTVGKGKSAAVDDVEAEVCFICASPVVHNSVAPCNHRSCHICALRLRALYKTRACAHCRVGRSLCQLVSP